MNPEIKKRFIFAGIGLATILLIGTFGYWFLTGGRNDLFSCFYMTVITITTIGYDEIIDLSGNRPARMFTILFAFAGIGLLTYFVSNVSAIVIEGHLRESYKKRRMDKEICKLHDHYIICGISKHSFHLIKELEATDRKSVFIEIDRNTINEVLRRFPEQCYVEGDATNDEILTRAGVQRAKGIFAATNDDNLNLVICLSARRLNPKAKIVSLCINHNNNDKLKLAGADTIVSPNYIGALRMASEMFRPVVTDFLDSMLRDKNKNLRIEEIDIKEKHNSKKIEDLKLDQFKDTLLIALKTSGGWVFKPGHEYEVKSGDSLIVMTTPEDRIKLENF